MSPRNRRRGAVAAKEGVRATSKGSASSKTSSPRVFAGGCGIPDEGKRIEGGGAAAASATARARRRSAMAMATKCGSSGWQAQWQGEKGEGEKEEKSAIRARVQLQAPRQSSVMITTASGWMGSPNAQGKACYHLPPLPRRNEITLQSMTPQHTRLQSTYPMEEPSMCTFPAQVGLRHKRRTVAASTAYFAGGSGTTVPRPPLPPPAAACC